MTAGTSEREDASSSVVPSSFLHIRASVNERCQLKRCQFLLPGPESVCLRLIGSGRPHYATITQEVGAEGDSRLARRVFLGSRYRPRGSLGRLPLIIKRRANPIGLGEPAWSRLQLPGVLKRANPGHGLIRPVSSPPTAWRAGGQLLTLHCHL